MGNFELASDFIINQTLKPHVDTNFRVVPTPGKEIGHDDLTNKPIYPKILTTGSGNAIQEPMVFEKLIAFTGKEKPNVVYIGTPFFDREDKYESGTASFRRIGCRIKRLMVAKECTTPSQEEMKRVVVDWPDLIIVSGGNSLFAMLRWQSIGLDVLLREAAVKGKVLCGGSAGCGCYFESMQTDSLKPEACKLSERVLAELSAEERLDWSFVKINCLGFVNAFCIPHIDTVGTNGIARVDIAKKMLLEANADADRPIFGFGVDEKAAIMYHEGKLSIYSAGDKKVGEGRATCHILFVNSLNQVECIPITPNTEEAMTMDEYIERAMRSVAALQSPLDLIVSTDVSDACHRRGYSGAIDLIGHNEDMEKLIASMQLGNGQSESTLAGDENVKPASSPMHAMSELPPLLEKGAVPNVSVGLPQGGTIAPNASMRSHKRTHTRSGSIDSFVDVILPLHISASQTNLSSLQ